MQINLLYWRNSFMEIMVMKYARTLNIDEVTEIADKLVREGLKVDLEEMDPEEVNELLETISDDDENDNSDDDTAEDIYRPILNEVNNFPAVATAEDFVRSIQNMSVATGIDNAGLWWEVLEECLALRIGRRNNCLA